MQQKTLIGSNLALIMIYRSHLTLANPKRKIIMKFFVDTAEIDEIRELNELGMVDGCDNKPIINTKIWTRHNRSYQGNLEIVSGPVSAEVTAIESDQMIAEGIKLAEIADNIAVKVPLTWED